MKKKDYTDKKRKKGFFKWFLVSILLIIIHPLWLPLPARFLMVRDNIQKADAVVVLSGDWNFDREAKAVELYKNGLADKVIRVFERENRGFDIIKKLLNSEATQEEIYTKYFSTNGLPRDSMIFGDAVATSTFDELKAAREIVLKNNFRSIILVTSDYHMRRALLTAKWLFRPDRVRVYNASVYSDRFNPDRWWLHEEDIRGVVFEFLSMCYYVTYHFTTGK